MLALVGDKSAASSTLATARRLSGLAGQIAPWFAVAGRLIQARTAILLGDGATARLLIAEARRAPDTRVAGLRGQRRADGGRVSAGPDVRPGAAPRAC